MTTKIGTNVVDLVFYHIFHNFFSQTIDYVTAHFTVTQPTSNSAFVCTDECPYTNVIQM